MFEEISILRSSIFPFCPYHAILSHVHIGPNWVNHAILCSFQYPSFLPSQIHTNRFQSWYIKLKPYKLIIFAIFLFQIQLNFGTNISWSDIRFNCSFTWKFTLKHIFLENLKRGCDKIARSQLNACLVEDFFTAYVWSTRLMKIAAAAEKSLADLVLTLENDQHVNFLQDRLAIWQSSGSLSSVVTIVDRVFQAALPSKLVYTKL